MQGRRVPWEFAGAGVAILLGLVAWLAPALPRSAAASPALAAPRFAEVQGIVSRRCAMCHNAQVANKSVQLHTPALVGRQAQQIYQQAVVQKTMPFNNATQMTEDERAALKRWFESGAAME